VTAPSSSGPQRGLPPGQTREDVEKTLGIGVHAKKRGYLWILVLVVVVVGGFLGLRSYAKTRAMAAQPVYQTAPVARADLSVTVTATGTLEGLNTVEVGAEVSGRVTEVLVDFNDHVKAGQLLAVIDPEQSQASVDEAAANVAAADASIAQAKATRDESKASLARVEAGMAHGLVSPQDLDTARAAAARAQASYTSAIAQATVARANQKSAKSKLGKTKILAPVDGMVLSRLIEPGQTVTAGFTTPVLFKITDDLRKMSLQVYVDEADVGRVKEGLDASFTVDAYLGRTFDSKVLQIHNEPKTESNVVSYEAILTAQNDDLLLRPGMTATATIVSEKKANALVVPNTALRFTPPVTKTGFGPPGVAPPAPDGPQVYVLENGAPKAVSVKTGSTDGTSTEITGGDLDVGAEVIVDVTEPAK
jgi:HlyD family secretion protein